MSDIVERCRRSACNCGAAYANAEVIGLLLMACQEDLADAADEIERLREVVNEARTEIRHT